jgi:homoserine/homoserine lactone efflux protein
MIDPDLFLTFVATVTVLMLIPGPNVALIIANSVAYGSAYGLLTVAGTSAAMVLQLIVASFGMTELLGSLGSWFEWLRWLGVAYLIYVGLTLWLSSAVDLTRVKPQPKSASRIFTRALLVSLTNPKTLLFYGAFLPQFVSSGPDVGMQLLTLSATFLGLALAVDGSWALAAGRARGLLASRGKLRNRISGGMMMGAGIGLALARLERS